MFVLMCSTISDRASAGILLEQVGGAHDLAGLAVAALRNLLGEPGLLQRVRRIQRQPFDRRHRPAGNLRDLRLARERALAVDVHHAGAAQTGAAAELGAGKLEALPQHPQQRRCRGCVGRRRLAVHNEIGGHGLLPVNRQRAARLRLEPLFIRCSLFVVRHSHAPWSLVRPASLDLSQRRLDPRRVERKVADTLAGGVGEGIGNGGDRGALRAFTGAQRALIRTVDQLDLDLRRLRHGEDRIARPVARQNPVFVETHLLLQRPAHRLDDAAFDLAREPIRD